MEVKKLVNVKVKIDANGMEPRSCQTDCKHFTGNISTLFNCELYTDQAISDDF